MRVHEHLQKRFLHRVLKAKVSVRTIRLHDCSSELHCTDRIRHNKVYCGIWIAIVCARMFSEIGAGTPGAVREVFMQQNSLDRGTVECRLNPTRTTVDEIHRLWEDLRSQSILSLQSKKEFKKELWYSRNRFRVKNIGNEFFSREDCSLSWLSGDTYGGREVGCGEICPNSLAYGRSVEKPRIVERLFDGRPFNVRRENRAIKGAIDVAMPIHKQAAELDTIACMWRLMAIVTARKPAGLGQGVSKSRKRCDALLSCMDSLCTDLNENVTIHEFLRRSYGTNRRQRGGLRFTDKDFRELMRRIDTYVQQEFSSWSDDQRNRFYHHIFYTKCSEYVRAERLFLSSFSEGFSKRWKEDLLTGNEYPLMAPPDTLWSRVFSDCEYAVDRPDKNTGKDPWGCYTDGILPTTFSSIAVGGWFFYTIYLKGLALEDQIRLIMQACDKSIHELDSFASCIHRSIGLLTRLIDEMSFYQKRSDRIPLAAAIMCDRIPIAAAIGCYRSMLTEAWKIRKQSQISWLSSDIAALRYADDCYATYKRSAKAVPSFLREDACILLADMDALCSAQNTLFEWAKQSFFKPSMETFLDRCASGTVSDQYIDTYASVSSAITSIRTHPLLSRYRYYVSVLKKSPLIHEAFKAIESSRDQPLVFKQWSNARGYELAKIMLKFRFLCEWCLVRPKLAEHGLVFYTLCLEGLPLDRQVKLMQECNAEPRDIKCITNALTKLLNDTLCSGCLEAIHPSYKNLPIRDAFMAYCNIRTFLLRPILKKQRRSAIESALYSGQNIPRSVCEHILDYDNDDASD